MAFTPFSYDMNIVTKLSDTPNVDDGLTAFQLKEKFDEGGKAIKNYINNTLLQEAVEKPSATGMLKAVDGDLVAAEAGKDYQAPIEAGEITAEKIADASVQRSKLATDALYSPWKAAQGSTDITAADIGCTFKNGYGQTYELVIAQENSVSIPEGAEIAAYAYGAAGEVLTIKSVGVRLLLDGDETLYPSGTTVRVAGANSMIALKKFLTSAANGDVWIITGNVEVVS